MWGGQSNRLTRVGGGGQRREDMGGGVFLGFFGVDNPLVSPSESSLRKPMSSLQALTSLGNCLQSDFFSGRPDGLFLGLSGYICFP